MSTALGKATRYRSTIDLKDRILDIDQLQDLQLAISGLIAAGHYNPNQISMRMETPLFSKRQGVFTHVCFDVEKPLEKPIRAMLSALRLEERPKGLRAKTQPVFRREVVYDAVVEYVRHLAKRTNTKLTWILWYHLDDCKDVHLLCIGPGIPIAQEGKLDSQSFTPEPKMRIPGYLVITLSSLKELRIACEADPDQLAIACLGKGDYQVLHGVQSRLLKELSWAKSGL